VEQVPKPPVETQAAAPPDDAFAAGLRGGPLGVLVTLVILFTGNVSIGKHGELVHVPLGAALVLLWTWRSRTPWRAIGYARPRSWIATVAGGVTFGYALKLVMKAIVMPLLGADPINHAYGFLEGNRGALPAAVWAMLVAGFGEETVFRGFMFERLGKLMGQGRGARTAIVLLTSAGFGLAHYSIQGLAGTEQATITGLVFGTIVAVTGRIWMVMIAHAAFDLTALAIIYLSLESRVSHLIFK